MPLVSAVFRGCLPWSNALKLCCWSFQSCSIRDDCAFLQSRLIKSASVAQSCIAPFCGEGAEFPLWSLAEICLPCFQRCLSILENLHLSLHFPWSVPSNSTTTKTHWASGTRGLTFPWFVVMFTKDWLWLTVSQQEKKGSTLKYALLLISLMGKWTAYAFSFSPR